MENCFFRAHRTNDLTKKLEKVGPFECDELEKHCRVSAKCYPTKVPALYTMTKEKCKSVFLVLNFFFRAHRTFLKFEFGKNLNFANFAIFAKFLLNFHKNCLFFKPIFCKNFEIAAVHKDANLVELEKCCQTHIFLQILF